MIECPFCKGNNAKLIKANITEYKKIKYKHYFCNDCLLEFFTPLVFEKGIYEGEEYEAYKEFHSKREYAPYWSLSLLDLIKKNNLNLEGKKILEIGAGDGINFSMFKANFNIENSNYSIIELDKKSIKVCNERGIKNVYSEMFDSNFVKNHNKKYDIIIFTEVFEHQIDPKGFMDSVFGLLNDNGLIFLTVPNKHRSFYFLSASTDLPPHHFLRFGKEFFYKNYKDSIIDYTCNNFKINNLKQLSIGTSLKYFNKNTYWFLFYPIYLYILLVGNLPNKGQGLSFIIKKT